MVTGAVATRNQLSGRETRRAVRSALAIASIFGTCSPMLMWIAVTRAKAIATESPTATPCERPPKIGSSSFASEGSPRKPMPIEAIVIPIWQAESDSSILSSCSTTASAPLFAFLGELFDFAAAAAHERELGRDEEAVDGDQQQQEDEQEDAHRLCGPVLRGRSSSAIRRREYSFPLRGSSESAILSRMRIASLVPSATEMLFALGLGDSVVAVTHECDYPPAGAFAPAPDPHRAAAEGLDAGEIDTRGEGDGRRGAGAVRARRGAARRARARPDRHPGDLRRLRRLLRGRGRGRGPAARAGRGSSSRTRARSARCSKT